MTAAMKARVSLNLPVSLKAEAKRYAQQDGVSLNQFIATALAEKIGALGAAALFADRSLGGDAASAIAFVRAAPDVSADDGDTIGP
ncbi:MAG: pilus assembly protein HicB [bacterium]|nr:pilus assembly protein HicB [bacterium]